MTIGEQQVTAVHEIKVAVNNPDPPNGQPQPDERITQAEYEKVVKGARLTDPVEEPISRTCKEDIMCLCSDPRGEFLCLFGCSAGHLHGVGIDPYKTTKHVYNPFTSNKLSDSRPCELRVVR